MPNPGATFLWTVEEGEDSIIASEAAGANYRWEGRTGPARTRQATFTQGDTQATLGTVEVTVAEEEVAEVEETPEPTATAEATEVAAAGPTPTPGAVLDPGDADAIVNMPANFRTGPSVAYSPIRVLDQGTRLQVIGRNAASDWLQVRRSAALMRKAGSSLPC